jgi:hypothetical protein
VIITSVIIPNNKKRRVTRKRLGNFVQSKQNEIKSENLEKKGEESKKAINALESVRVSLLLKNIHSIIIEVYCT